MFRSVLCTMMVVLFLGLVRGDCLAQTRVRASYGSLAVSQVVLPLGVRAGIFQKNGLAIEPIYIGGRSVSALISGDVQFGFMGGPPAILARVGGADVVLIAGLNGLDQILVAVPAIKRGTDLIGKKVGISRFGTTADYGARIGLKKLKLQPQKDVTLIQIGDTPARVGGMLSGAIEAATLSSSEKELAFRNGFHVLADNADVEFPGNAVVTTRAYLKSNWVTPSVFQPIDAIRKSFEAAEVADVEVLFFGCCANADLPTRSRTRADQGQGSLRDSQSQPGCISTRRSVGDV
jgi:NitT/TauT family transport system substrate-binding protein